MPNAKLGLSVVLLLAMWSTGQAASPATAPHDAGAAGDAAGAALHDPRPVLPEPSPLAGSMLILIAGLFLAAAIVGPVVRYHAPEEAPEPAPHDEHGHGAHGHGH